MKKRGNLEQWRELAVLTREVHNKLIKLCVKADQIMPQKDWKYADRAQGSMIEFRSHAEDVMFKQLGEAGGARIDIFYGRIDGSYRAS